MSSSKYYFFGINGGAPIATITRRNGFGSHPVIWKYLCKKYLDSDMWILVVERFWKEPEIAARMTADDRFLLRVTYDGFLVRRADFIRLARILQDVFGDVPETYTNHWTQPQGDAAKEDPGNIIRSNGYSIINLLNDHADNVDVLGMGVYATSVSDDVWITRPPVDDEGQELEGEYGWVDARTAPVAGDEE